VKVERLHHSKVELALHTLREGEGRALLLLHGLGERTPAAAPPELAAWLGPIYGLDFTGHGQSTIPRGGGYTCEILMGDADTALRHLKQATLVGRGLGAYVALLLAGARPAEVRGAILRDGLGLAGGGHAHDPVPEPGRRWHPRPVRPRRAVARRTAARLRDRLPAPGERALRPRPARERLLRRAPRLARRRRQGARRPRDQPLRGAPPLRRHPLERGRSFFVTCSRRARS
jgi:pimeloyl-ACP methyl ester carboxylesterase